MHINVKQSNLPLWKYKETFSDMCFVACVLI